MTISYEEFKELFYSYLNTPSGEQYQHSFRSYILDYHWLTSNLNFEWALEKRSGLTEEQACKILYTANILNTPLDQVYQKLSIGDVVVTRQGLIGTITGITPKKYLNLIIKGSNRQVRRYCTSVTKINFNLDDFNT